MSSSQIIKLNPKSLRTPTLEDGRERSMPSIPEPSGDVQNEVERYASMLEHLGLVKSVVTSEGVSYEVTETGSRFVKDYKGLEVNSDRIRKVDTGEIFVRLAKDQVTVVIPTLNEAEGISEVLKEVKEEGYKNVLVIEGYSEDRTAEKVHENGVKVVYQHGPGKAGAVRTAIERAKTPYLLFMDGDCTYDPKDIWRLLNHSEHYVHVIGARDRGNIPRLHRLGNWLISQVFSILFGVKVSDVCSGMYLIETEKARNYKLEESGFNVEIELAAHSASSETLTEVPINYRHRVGEGKLSAWNGFSILFAAFALARRYNPILLYSSLAGLSIIPAGIILGWVGLEVLISGIWHSAWILLGVMLLLIAAQAFTLASVSILTKHSEERLMRELKKAREKS
jgi:glycosyltransferase involved in cell wall biosynthesis